MANYTSTHSGAEIDNAVDKAILTDSQSLTDAQKLQARTNIGAGTSDLALGSTSDTAAAGNHTHDDYVPKGSTNNVLAIASTS